MARRPNDPEKELKIQWSKKENDFVIFYPRSCDGHYIYGLISHPETRVTLESCVDKEYEKIDYRVLENPNLVVARGRTLIEELEARGYDTTTLKITVKRKDKDE